MESYEELYRKTAMERDKVTAQLSEAEDSLKKLSSQVKLLEEDLIKTKRKYFEALCLGIKNKESEL